MRFNVYTTVFVIVLVIFGIALAHRLNNAPKPIAVSYNQLTAEARKEVKCLADNIYFEAGFEPVEGQVAVALVTLNRTEDSRYPKTICGVVKQRIQHVCQFSWWCEPRKKMNDEVYNSVMQIALHVYANQELLKDITHGALFYHADYVNPRWRGVEKTTKIGRHIFYKEKDNVTKVEPAVEERSGSPFIFLAYGRN